MTPTIEAPSRPPPSRNGSSTGTTPARASSSAAPSQAATGERSNVRYLWAVIGLAVVGAGKTFGFGNRWEQLPLVKQHRWLA